MAEIDKLWEDAPNALKESVKAKDKLTLGKLRHLVEFVLADIVQVAPYLTSTPSIKKVTEKDRIVCRSCYSHILPIVQAAVERGERIAVGGTPGVGKTIFGLFVFRAYVTSGQAVLYWNKNQATLLTKNEGHRDELGLGDSFQLLGDKWYWGGLEYGRQESR